MAFVCRQLFWWSESITLANNNAVLTDLYRHFSHFILYHIPQLASPRGDPGWGLLMEPPGNE